MNLDLIHNEFPIWEVTDWLLPDVDYSKSTSKDYDQSSKHYKSSNLRQQLNAELNMYEQGVIIQNMLRDSNLLVLDQMWKGHLKRLCWPEGYVSLLLDRPNFKMDNHIDNRYVLGVLIINLQDNPKGSGTHFPMLNYSGPIKRGTGVFFLNHNNTEHSINQPGPEDRIIAYQTLTLDNLRYD